MNILIFSKPFFTAFHHGDSLHVFSIGSFCGSEGAPARLRARLTCFQTERTPGPEQGEGIEPKPLAPAICSDSSVIPLLGAQSERSPAGGEGALMRVAGRHWDRREQRRRPPPWTLTFQASNP